MSGGFNRRPDCVEEHRNSCERCERGSRIVATTDALARALQHCPEAHPAIILHAAELLKCRSEIEGARARLENSVWLAPDDDTRETAAYLLCDLCDRLEPILPLLLVWAEKMGYPQR